MCSQKNKASPIRATDVEVVVVQQRPRQRAPPKKPANVKQPSSKKKPIIVNRREEFQKLMKPKKKVDQIRLQFLQNKFEITLKSDYQYKINNSFTGIYNKLKQQRIKPYLKPPTLNETIITMMQIVVQPEIIQQPPLVQITLCDLLKSTNIILLDFRARHHQDLLNHQLDNKFQIAGLHFRYKQRLLKLTNQITMQKTLVQRIKAQQRQIQRLVPLQSQFSDYYSKLQQHIKEGLIIDYQPQPLENIQIFYVPKQAFESAVIEQISVQLPRNKNLEQYQKKSTLLTMDKSRKQGFDKSQDLNQMIGLQLDNKRQIQRKQSHNSLEDEYIPNMKQQKPKGKESTKLNQKNSAKKSLRNKRVSQNQKDVQIVALNFKQENNFIYNQLSEEQNTNYQMQMKKPTNQIPQYDNRFNAKTNQSMNIKQYGKQDRYQEDYDSNRVNKRFQQQKQPSSDYTSDISDQEYQQYLPEQSRLKKVQSLDDKRNQQIVRQLNYDVINKRDSYGQPSDQFNVMQNRNNNFQNNYLQELNSREQAQRYGLQQSKVVQQRNRYSNPQNVDFYQQEPKPDIRRFHQLEDQNLPRMNAKPTVLPDRSRIINQQQYQNPRPQNTQYPQYQIQQQQYLCDDEDNVDDEQQFCYQQQQQAYPRQPQQTYQGQNSGPLRTPPPRNQKQRSNENRIPYQDNRIQQRPQIHKSILKQQREDLDRNESDRDFLQENNYNQQNNVQYRQNSMNDSNDSVYQNSLLQDISNRQKQNNFLAELNDYSYQKNNRPNSNPKYYGRQDQQSTFPPDYTKRYPQDMKSSMLQSSMIMNRREQRKILINWVVFISDASQLQLPPVISLNNFKISTVRLDERYFDECEYILMSDQLKLIFLRQEDVLIKEIHDKLLGGDQEKAIASIGRFFNTFFQDLLFKHKRVSIVVFLEYKQKYFSFLINEYIQKNLLQQNRIQIFQYQTSDELSQFLLQKLNEYEDLSADYQFQIPDNLDIMIQRMQQLNQVAIDRLKSVNKIYTTLQQAYG